MVYQAGMDSVIHEYTRLRLEYSYAFRKTRDIPRALVHGSRNPACKENHSVVFL
jgi:hypothetical protein